MARDVEADVNIRDKSDKGLRGFLGRLRGAEDAVKKTQAEIDKAAKASGRFGKSAEENGKALAKLRNETAIARTELGTLARAFANAGTAAERVDISKAMRKTQQEIRNLTKNADVLKALVPDPAAFAPVSVSLKGALIAGGVAASPILAGALSAAVIGGAAGAGILGGVLLVADDPAVKAAGTRLGKNLLGSLKEDASVFVEPVLDTIDLIGGRFEQLRPKLRSIFDNSSKFLEPLADGALDAIDSILDGIQSLVANAGPVVDALSGSMRILGDSASISLKAISGGSDEAAKSLTALSYAVGGSMIATGYAIRGLTEVSGFVIDRLQKKWHDLTEGTFLAGDETKKAAEKARQMAPVADIVAGSIAKLNIQTKAGVVETDQYGHAVQTTGEALLTLDERITQVYDTQHSLFDSATTTAQSWRNLNESIDANGRSLKTNSQEGLNNRTALSGVVSALNANYEAFVRVNGEGEAANGIAQQNYDSFVNKVSKGFHISKASAADYARQLGLVPPATNTKANFNTHDAEGRADTLNHKIKSIPGSKNVTVSASTRAALNAVAAAQRVIDAMHGKTVTIRVTRQGEVLYGRQAPQMAAGGTFALGGAGAGMSRAAAPTPVQVANSVQVFLDSTPIRAYVLKTVNDAVDRAAYRQRVGRR